MSLTERVCPQSLKALFGKRQLQWCKGLGTSDKLSKFLCLMTSELWLDCHSMIDTDGS